jgi:tetratricopeptide (TPR) repeat protein
MPADFADNSLREPDDFERALAASEKAAQRRQKQFWVLGVVWVAVVLLGVFYYRSQIDRLEQRLEGASNALSVKVDSLTAQVDVMRVQVTTINRLRQDLFALRDSLERNISARTKDLDPLSSALELAQAKVAFEPLTREEEEALDTQRRKVQEQETTQALYLQGSALVTDDPQTAIKKLEAAVGKDPKYEPAWAALGSAYRYAFQYKNAEHALLTAIGMNPNRTSTRFELCYVQMRLQTVVKDSACDSKGWNSNDWRKPHSNGFNAYRLEKYDEAEREWRRAAELRPTPAGSLENLGLIYVRQSQWQKAFDNAQMVKLIDPESSWNWLFLWISADRLGRKDQSTRAREAWKKFMTSDDVETLKPLLPAELQSFVTP